MIKFFCFKWGDKYGPEYVNRLRNSVKKYYQDPFVFTCVTDDVTGIDDGIETMNINNFVTHGNTNLFTAQKFELMGMVPDGVILDLDILIHNDLAWLFEYETLDPKFIWTHWTPSWHVKNIPARTACFINSSFVKWDNDNARFIFQHYIENRDRVENIYDSCDKYLFYEHHLPEGSFDYWDASLFYNYNEAGEWQYKFNPDAVACLFNTSHLVKMNRRYYELDNTPTEHTEIWESYDEL